MEQDNKPYEPLLYDDLLQEYKLDQRERLKLAPTLPRSYQRNVNLRIDCEWRRGNSRFELPATLFRAAVEDVKKCTRKRKLLEETSYGTPSSTSSSGSSDDDRFRCNMACNNVQLQNNIDKTCKEKIKRKRFECTSDPEVRSRSSSGSSHDSRVRCNLACNDVQLQNNIDKTCIEKLKRKRFQGTSDHEARSRRSSKRSSNDGKEPVEFQNNICKGKSKRKHFEENLDYDTRSRRSSSVSSNDGRELAQFQNNINMTCKGKSERELLNENLDHEIQSGRTSIGSSNDGVEQIQVLKNMPCVEDSTQKREPFEKVLDYEDLSKRSRTKDLLSYDGSVQNKSLMEHSENGTRNDSDDIVFLTKTENDYFQFASSYEDEELKVSVRYGEELSKNFESTVIYDNDNYYDNDFQMDASKMYDEDLDYSSSAILLDKLMCLMNESDRCKKQVNSGLQESIPNSKEGSDSSNKSCQSKKSSESVNSNARSNNVGMISKDIGRSNDTGLSKLALLKIPGNPNDTKTSQQDCSKQDETDAILSKANRYLQLERLQFLSKRDYVTVKIAEEFAKLLRKNQKGLKNGTTDAGSNLSDIDDPIKKLRDEFLKSLRSSAELDELKSQTAAEEKE